MERGVRSDGKPSWWRGRAEASQSALATARAFGIDVSAVIAQAQAG